MTVVSACFIFIPTWTITFLQTAQICGSYLSFLCMCLTDDKCLSYTNFVLNDLLQVSQLNLSIFFNAFSYEKKIVAILKTQRHIAHSRDRRDLQSHGEDLDLQICRDVTRCEVFEFQVNVHFSTHAPVEPKSSDLLAPVSLVNWSTAEINRQEEFIRLISS